PPGWISGSIRHLFVGQYLKHFVLAGWGVLAANQNLFLLSLLFFCFGPCLFVIINLLIFPFGSSIPSSCRTIKGLVKSILNSDCGRIAVLEKGWQEQEVWGALRCVLVEALNVRSEEIYPDSHLVWDLGMD